MVDLLKRLALFFAFVVVQALVLNHIHLFGFATPLMYVYFVILFRRDEPRWAMLLWAFAMGLCVDVLGNTPGIASASLTLTALVQPYLLMLFVTRDSADDLQPSIRSFGLSKYVYFAAALVLLFCVTFYTIEAFSFLNWWRWIECVVGSTVLTVILILVIENLRR